MENVANDFANVPGFLDLQFTNYEGYDFIVVFFNHKTLHQQYINSHWKCHKKGEQNFFIKVDKKKFVAQYYH